MNADTLPNVTDEDVETNLGLISQTVVKMLEGTRFRLHDRPTCEVHESRDEDGRVKRLPAYSYVVTCEDEGEEPWHVAFGLDARRTPVQLLATVREQVGGHLAESEGKTLRKITRRVRHLSPWSAKRRNFKADRAVIELLTIGAQVSIDDHVGTVYAINLERDTFMVAPCKKSIPRGAGCTLRASLLVPIASSHGKLQAVPDESAAPAYEDPDAPRAEYVGTDLGEEGQKYAKAILKGEEKARIAGHEYVAKQAAEQAKADDYYCIVKRLGPGRWKAETIGEVNMGCGILWAIGKTPEGAVRKMHEAYAYALRDIAGNTDPTWKDWRKCLDKGIAATFRLTEVIR